MRNDLPSLNAGKAMAQAAHAANSLTAEWGHTNGVQEWTNKENQFGTTIVLSVTKADIEHALRRAQMRDGVVPHGPVWDQTYPFITTTEIAALVPKRILTAPSIVKEDNKVIMFRRELTCAYIFVLDGSSDQKELVGGYPLHP